MKKVFLLLTSTLMGIAALAGDPWTYDEDKGELAIQWNSYGTKDAEGTSIQWQGGNIVAITDAIEESGEPVTYSEGAWTASIGDIISVSLKGKPNKSGKLQCAVVDEREIAAWYTAMSNYIPETQITAGEEFTFEGFLIIDNVTTDQNGTEVEGGLTAGGVLFGFSSDLISTDEGFDTDPLIISDATLSISFEKPVDYENPMTFAYQKPSAETENFQYQSMTKSAVAFADIAADKYANVTFEGKATKDVATMMFVLADNAQQADGHYFEQTSEMQTFAANIKAGDQVKKQFSYKLEKTSSPAEGISADIRDVILAEASVKGATLVFENGKISVTISDTPEFEGPNVAVEEVSNVVFENGVIYSASIVVYNQAGQVVATASEAFAINSLNAGVYFAKTAEGTMSFVVK